MKSLLGFMLVAGILIVCEIPFLTPPAAAVVKLPQQPSPTAPTWTERLYEKGVQYENFACDPAEAGKVANYFGEHPLRDFLPICHNDCPVIKCRPVVPLPAVARAAPVPAGNTVSVHILVDEKGRVLYARVLTGHPLVREAIRKGACDTVFTEYRYGKRRGVMHFTIDGSEYIGVPNTANEVR